MWIIQKCSRERKKFISYKGAWHFNWSFRKETKQFPLKKIYIFPIKTAASAEQNFINKINYHASVCLIRCAGQVKSRTQRKGGAGITPIAWSWFQEKTGHNKAILPWSLAILSGCSTARQKQQQNNTVSHFLSVGTLMHQISHFVS